MTYFFIYLSIVIMMNFVDAMLCVITKRRYGFLTSFAATLFFPVTLPIFLYHVNNLTKNFPEADDYFADLPDEN